MSKDIQFGKDQIENYQNGDIDRPYKSKEKYKFKRINQFPEHVKAAFYAITYYGYTIFPEDVIKQ